MLRHRVVSPARRLFVAPKTGSFEVAQWRGSVALQKVTQVVGDCTSRGNNAGSSSSARVYVCETWNTQDRPECHRALVVCIEVVAVGAVSSFASVSRTAAAFVLPPAFFFRAAGCLLVTREAIDCRLLSQIVCGRLCWIFHLFPTPTGIRL